MRKSLRNVLSALVLSLMPTLAFSAVHYVKADGTGDGSSWANATTLQAAIDAAQSGDEVWVARGDYKPETLIKSSKKTSKAFILKDGVSLYGGFAGTETSKNQRAMTEVTGQEIKVCSNLSVLNADDDVTDVWTRAIESGSSSRYTWQMETSSTGQWVTGTRNNSTHVLYCGSEFTQKTVIDGFTLKGGNANVWNVKAHGGAVYAIGDVHISHCRILENSAYFTAESSSDSNSYGGAVYLDAKGKGSITDCYFESAYCHSSYGNGVGGAVCVKNGTVSNCYFKNCVASDYAGAVYAQGGSKVTDCVAEDCYGGTAGAFYVDATSSVEDCTAVSCRGINGGGFVLLGSALHCAALNCYADAPEYASVGGGKGGGFYVAKGSMLGCVASNNQSYAGGGVFVAEGKVVNTTAVFNVLRDGTTKNNIDGAEGFASSVFNTIYDTNVARSNFENPAAFDGRATTAADSLKLLTTELSLKKGSEFIDAGTLTEGFTESEDFDGNPRVVGKSIDVGAYEYQGGQEATPNIVINFTEGTKAAKIGMGGVTGYEFQVDWGDGELVTYDKATYYSHTVTGDQVKVYGDEVRVLYANDQNVKSIDMANTPLLQTLQAQNNQLTSLNITSNPLLTGVYVTGNKISSIDLSKNEKLRVIDISNNALEGTLDCSAITALSKVDCSGNKLSALTLPHHSTVYQVLCDDNQLTTLDLSGLTGMNEVSCHGNKLAALNLDGLTSLEEVYAYDNEISSFSAEGCKSLKTLNLANNKLSSINIEKLSALEGLYLYDNSLTALDITKNPAIRWINIDNNQIAELNTSAQTNLTLLYADNNQLSSVDFSGNRSISQLKLAGNKLSAINLSMLSYLSNCQLGGNLFTSIDVSKNAYLYWLGVADNMLTTLDLSKNTYVQWVAAENNHLTALDLSNNKSVQGLTLQHNNMDADAINAIIAQLQNVSSVTVDDSNREWARQLNISYMPGTAAANVDDATAKGWYVTAEVSSSVTDLGAADATVASKQYFTIGGVALGAEVPESGLYIVKTTYTNGKVKFTKEMVVK